MKWKRFFSILLATVMTLPALCHTPIFAADSSANRVVIMPNYPLERDDAGCLYLNTADLVDFSLEIVQHSEEREALCLYSLETQNSVETIYYFQLEPGSYELTLSAPMLANGIGIQTYTFPFTIANPDYETQFSSTSYLLSFAYQLADSDDNAGFQLSDEQMNTQNDLCTISRTLYCKAMQGMLGDINADQKITVQDAMMVLTHYAAQIVGKPAVLVNKQALLADIDSNGILNTVDATLILQYYLKTLIGETPSWDTIQGM